MSVVLKIPISYLVLSGIDFQHILRYCIWSEGGENFIDEQELLDMFIPERIDMLLTKLSKMRPKKSAEEHQRILQAEQFIDSLPDKN